VASLPLLLFSSGLNRFVQCFQTLLPFDSTVQQFFFILQEGIWVVWAPNLEGDCSIFLTFHVPLFPTSVFFVFTSIHLPSPSFCFLLCYPSTPAHLHFFFLVERGSHTFRHFVVGAGTPPARIQTWLKFFPFLVNRPHRCFSFSIPQVLSNCFFSTVLIFRHL